MIIMFLFIIQEARGKRQEAREMYRVAVSLIFHLSSLNV